MAALGSWGLGCAALHEEFATGSVEVDALEQRAVASSHRKGPIRTEKGGANIIREFWKEMSKLQN